MTLLDVVIFLPLVAFLMILFFPKSSVEGIRRFSLLASTVNLRSVAGVDRPYWFSTPGRWTFVTICHGLIRLPSAITWRWMASACGW